MVASKLLAVDSRETAAVETEGAPCAELAAMRPWIRVGRIAVIIPPIIGSIAAVAGEVVSQSMMAG